MVYQKYFSFSFGNRVLWINRPLAIETDWVLILINDNYSWVPAFVAFRLFLNHVIYNITSFRPFVDIPCIIWYDTQLGSILPVDHWTSSGVYNGTFPFLYQSWIIHSYSVSLRRLTHREFFKPLLTWYASLFKIKMLLQWNTSSIDSCDVDSIEDMVLNRISCFPSCFFLETFLFMNQLSKALQYDSFNIINYIVVEIAI